MVTGGCPYNDLLMREMRARGIDMLNHEDWGRYMPDQMDNILAHMSFVRPDALSALKIWIEEVIN